MLVKKSKAMPNYWTSETGLSEERELHLDRIIQELGNLLGDVARARRQFGPEFAALPLEEQKGELTCLLRAAVELLFCLAATAPILLHCVAAWLVCLTPYDFALP